MRIAVVGAGGHGKVVADALLSAGSVELVGLLDDDEALWGTKILELPVLGSIRCWAGDGIDAVAMGIGGNAERHRLFQRLAEDGARFATVIHPSAVIGREVSIGTASVVLANVVVNAGTVVGDNVILNTACTVDHDCVLETSVHVAPGAHLAGAVRVGEGSLVGAGATILPGIAVGSWSTVGGGAAVTRDIPGGVTVVGVPAREIRR
jgi:sugar O-acyltransferase (sialic acid O-acetyltransferase NeuD family)